MQKEELMNESFNCENRNEPTDPNVDHKELWNNNIWNTEQLLEGTKDNNT